MASLSNGDGPLQRLGTRLSESFLNPAKPKAPKDPDYDPQRIIPVDERKEAMSGLDPVERKWANGAFILALLSSILLVIIVSTQHAKTRIPNTNKFETSTGVTTGALLIGVIVLFFSSTRY